MNTDLTHQQYKELIEARIQGNAGSTQLEVLLQCLTAVASAMLSQDVAQALLAMRWLSFHVTLARLAEFVLLFGPTLLCMTAETEIQNDWIAAITLTCFAIFRIASRWMSRSRSFNVKELSVSTRPPFVTIYRASLMVMTCLAILCVDFLIFPKRFIKTEAFGISLMDIGVGQFVFSAAVAFGGKLASEDAKGQGPQLRSRFSRKFLGSTVPLIAFGGIRFIMVSLAEYQEHVSEYGKHWNFFITLACLPVMYVTFEVVRFLVCQLSFLRRIVHAAGRVAGLGAVTVLILHQTLLLCGLTDYVETPLRRTFVEANKEGIVSMLGYLAIFLAGSDCGWLLFRHRATRKRRDHLRAGMLCIAAAIVLYYFAQLLDNHVQQISRKTCNAAYTTFVVSLSLVALGALYLLDVASARRDEAASTTEQTVQQRFTILECINENQFPLFLVANVSTGLVNITMRTIFQPSEIAYAVMIIYAAWLSSIALVWHERLGRRLKFW